MPAVENGRNSFGEAMVRMGTVTGAALAMICMGVTGPLVALREPYLIPVLPFLGIGGLACCVGAVACVLGNSFRTARISCSLRALGWMSGAVGVAFLLWTLGRPLGEGFGPEVILIGVVLSGATILGIVGMMLLPPLFLFATRGDDRGHDGRPRSAGSTTGTEGGPDGFDLDDTVPEGAA